MNILITISHKAELEPLLLRFGNCQPDDVGQVTVYRCSAGEVNVTILQTGMGVDNASRSLQAFLKLDSVGDIPDFIFNVGSAGALNPKHNIGDLVVGTTSIRETRPGQDRKLRSQWIESLGKFLLERDVNYFEGTILSVKKPVKSTEKKTKMFMETGADVVEMECDGLAEEANERGIPLLSVKCISDLAGEDVSNEYNLHLPVVTQKLSELVYGFVTELSGFQD